MAQSVTGRTVTDAEAVADYIVEEFAAANKGVAEVMPAEEIQSQLEDVIEQTDAFDDADWDDLYDDVKDAVLEQGVFIT